MGKKKKNKTGETKLSVLLNTNDPNVLLVRPAFQVWEIAEAATEERTDETVCNFFPEIKKIKTEQFDNSEKPTSTMELIGKVFYMWLEERGAYWAAKQNRFRPFMQSICKSCVWGMRIFYQHSGVCVASVPERTPEHLTISSHQLISLLEYRYLNLKEIRLQNCTRITNKCLELIVSEFKKLEVVDLEGCTSLTGASLGTNISALRELRVLNLNYMNEQDGLQDSNMLQICDHCKYIEELHLAYADQITPQLYDTLVQNQITKRLKKLTLDGCTQLALRTSVGTLNSLIRDCPNLVYLSLGNLNVMDEPTLRLISGCTSLQTLRLVNNPISNLVSLGRSLKQLTQLDLSLCDHLLPSLALSTPQGESIPVFCNLKRLQISSVAPRPTFVEELLSSLGKYVNQLVEVGISGATDAPSAVINNFLINTPQLQKLLLGQVRNFDNSCCFALREHCPFLDTLHVTQENEQVLYDEGFEALAEMPLLTSVHFQSCKGFDNSSLTAFKKKKMLYLHLKRNLEVSTSAVRSINGEELEYLHLGDTGVGEMVFDLLASMKFPNLRVLGLSLFDPHKAEHLLSTLPALKTAILPIRNAQIKHEFQTKFRRVEFRDF